MRKYIDLAPTIRRDRMLGPITGLDGESYALQWLDSHPGQVPGLATAITRSQWDAATKIADQFVVCDIANAWGLCIIPDPEPTNAEKATADLEAWGVHRVKALELGPWLVGQGWAKEPEADDD